MIQPKIDQVVIGHATAPAMRWSLGILGLAIIVFTLLAIIRRDSSFIAAFLWFVAGALLSVFSIWPMEVIKFIVSTDYVTRIRFITGAISIFVLLITFESIRRTHLKERYAILWIITGLVLFVCVLFPNAVDLLRAVSGMSYPTAVAVVASLFLVLVTFHFSIAMSASEDKQSKMAQKLAVLEARIRALEKTTRGDEKKQLRS